MAVFFDLLGVLSFLFLVTVRQISAYAFAKTLIFARIFSLEVYGFAWRARDPGPNSRKSLQNLQRLSNE